MHKFVNTNIEVLMEGGWDGSNLQDLLKCAFKASA